MSVERAYFWMAKVNSLGTRKRSKLLDVNVVAYVNVGCIEISVYFLKINVVKMVLYET